jgi:cell wall-associated NlpC family hydrolase
MAQSVKAASISDLEREREELERQREEAQRQQDEQRRQLSGISGQISSLEGNADEVAGEIEEMDAALVETIASVEIIEEEIEEKEEQIEITTQEYEQAKATEEAQYEAMKLRIRFMYEKGDATYLQLILESHSIGEMMNKADYISQLYEYDRKMLQAYQEAREATLAIKEQLEDERSELEAQQHELEEEKESLEIMLAEKQRVYDNYEVQIAQARQEAAIYKANIKKQTDNIRKLQAAASAKESEIEAAKRAEEEARKAQEEALRRQAEEEAGRQSGDSDSSSEGSAGESGSSGGSESSGSSGSSDNYASASSYSGSGSKGQQIANYACQFIGNPYVPGGTSLTQGADCSGFVWRVYKDFGYTVPRTSYGCRSAGSGVSYSEAQPGDIVCYAGHVGLYIGNGQIVHASTQRSGIKITTATYKEILTVRRIV